MLNYFVEKILQKILKMIHYDVFLFILPYCFSIFKLESENRSILEFISKAWKVNDPNTQIIQFLSDDISYHAALNEESMEKLLKSQKCKKKKKVFILNH